MRASATGSVAHISNIYKRNLNRIKTAWENHVRNNFAGQGSEVGGWDALADSTIEKRINMGFSPGPILDMTGQLKNSWVVDVSLSGTEVTATLEFPSALPSLDGSMFDIARMHHEGTTVPKRELFDSAELESMMYDIMDEIAHEVLAEVLM